MFKKIILVFGILFLVGFSVLVIGSTQPQNIQSNQEQDHNKNLKLVKELESIKIENTFDELDSKPEISKQESFIEEIKTKSLDVSYSELVLNSEKYIDKIIHYKGKIIDIRNYIDDCGENCYVQYELTISQHTGYGNYDQPIHVVYNTKNDPKLKEWDNIELWGTFTQLVPITTGWGQHAKIPDFYVYYVDIEIIK